MSTLAEIEQAIEALSSQQVEELGVWLSRHRQARLKANGGVEKSVSVKRYFGSFASGESREADNEQIDRDLACAAARGLRWRSTTMLLDTSGLYTLLDASESWHELAKREFARANKPFTHAYVLAELVPLAAVRGVPRRLFLEFISALFESGEVAIAWGSRELHEAAHRLLLSRMDKNYSLCDAVSFVVMRERAEQEALTTDHHFEQKGFVRLLRN